MAGHRVFGKGGYVMDNIYTITQDKLKRTNPNTPTFFIIGIVHPVRPFLRHNPILFYYEKLKKLHCVSKITSHLLGIYGITIFFQRH